MMEPDVRDRIVDLLTDPPADPDWSEGYLDLLGTAPPAPSPAQRVMESTFLPRIYEQVWRPVGFNVAKGWPLGPDTAREHAMARARLGLGQPGRTGNPDATVLDVACGPGNVTRALATGVSTDGLVVGLDAAPGMLARAVATPPPGGASTGYVRGDAVHLPFRDGAFDAVSCLGALYLFDDPWAAISGMVRVLRPGGRLAILTSRRPRLPLSRPAGRAIKAATGFRLFGDHEITDTLTDHGLEHITRHRYPAMQFITAHRPI